VPPRHIWRIPTTGSPERGSEGYVEHIDGAQSGYQHHVTNRHGRVIGLQVSSCACPASIWASSSAASVMAYSHDLTGSGLGQILV
jgi:hypothetical protein